MAGLVCYPPSAAGSNRTFTSKGLPVSTDRIRRSRKSSSRISSAKPFFKWASCSGIDSEVTLLFYLAKPPHAPNLVADRLSSWLGWFSFSF
jgi:hypothetical protein